MIKKCTFQWICILAIIVNNAYAQTQNTLTPAEKKDGWQLLFNGRDLKGWHSFQETTPGKSWQVHNGTISLNKNNKSKPADYKDLVTDEEYENFDFKTYFFLSLSHCSIPFNGIAFQVISFVSPPLRAADTPHLIFLISPILCASGFMEIITPLLSA